MFNIVKTYVSWLQPMQPEAIFSDQSKRLNRIASKIAVGILFQAKTSALVHLPLFFTCSFLEDKITSILKKKTFLKNIEASITSEEKAIHKQPTTAHDDLREMTREMGFSKKSHQIVALAVLYCATAPITEEVLFRWIPFHIQNKLVHYSPFLQRRKARVEMIVRVISSVTFANTHSGMGIAPLMYTGAVGFITFWPLMAKHGFIACTAAHVTTNTALTLIIASLTSYKAMSKLNETI